MIAHLKSKIKQYFNQQSGFSIVEVLIAVAIVGTGMLAYGTLSGSIMSANTKSTKKSIAITLAQDKIEELRNLTLRYKELNTALTDTNPVYLFQTPPSTSEWVDSADELLDAEGGNTGPLNFTRTWTIVQSTVDASTGGGSHLFDARVTVSWNNNGDQSVTLDSKITD